MRSLSIAHVFKSALSAVWRAVSDTDCFNKQLGFPPVRYRDEPQPDGTSRRMCTQGRFGIEVEYEELPFSWVHERSFRVERLYKNGPFSRLIHTCHLEPSNPADPNAGCLARVIWEWEPRSALEALIAAAGIRQFALKPFVRVFTALDAKLLREARAATDAVMPVVRAEKVSLEVQRGIAELLPRVKEIRDSPLLPRLAEAIAEGSDDALRRMQPLFYAHAWSADVQDTVDTFLAATTAGLLRMRWDVICPHCRGDKKNLASLSEATQSAFCAACNIDFDVDLDRGLEAVFTPHPQVRVIEEARYCLGGPGVTPHVHYQHLFAPGEERTVEITLPRGRYRVRASGEKTYRWLDVERGSNAGAFDVLDRGIDGNDLSVSTEPLKLTFRNRASRRALVNVESVSWAANALSAGELISDQRFRDLFTGEVLAPGIKLAVESVTILFTDLVGSTAMYEQLGDASAFGLVWAHFDVLRETISGHRGAIVKTIGDAIMAVFMRPDDALLAAGELHDQVGARCLALGHTHPVTLKIGMHTGPCIAVTLNDRLDYFGSTVNLAARVEAQSRGGDIVVSKAIAQRTRDGDSLRKLGWRSEAIEAACKGFAEPIAMLRFTQDVSREQAASKPQHAPA